MKGRLRAWGGGRTTGSRSMSEAEQQIPLSSFSLVVCHSCCCGQSLARTQAAERNCVLLKPHCSSLVTPTSAQIGLPWWQMVNSLPLVWRTWVRSLGWEDPLEKGMATHSSILAWRIPWTEEPGRLPSMGSQKVGHDWVTNTFTLSALIGSWTWRQGPKFAVFSLFYSLSSI